MKRVLYCTILFCICFICDVSDVFSYKIQAQEICDVVKDCIDARVEELTEIRDILTSEDIEDGVNVSANGTDLSGDDLEERNSIDDVDYNESSDIELDKEKEDVYKNSNDEGVLQKIFSSKEDLSNGILQPLQASDFVQTTDGFENSLSSSVYKTINHYFCFAQNFKDNHLILYDTKSWTFPKQDVNLTLSYPTITEKSKHEADTTQASEEDDYIITGFKVELYIDGVETNGYITKGGVLKDKITLAFISRGISSLSYKFWLYGTPRSTTSTIAELNSYFTCS